MDPNLPQQTAVKEECNPCADDSGSTIFFGVCFTIRAPSCLAIFSNRLPRRPTIEYPAWSCNPANRQTKNQESQKAAAVSPL
jgi:hypothetical protein